VAQYDEVAPEQRTLAQEPAEWRQGANWTQSGLRGATGDRVILIIRNVDGEGGYE
jgi:hypothetical protein